MNIPSRYRSIVAEAEEKGIIEDHSLTSLNWFRRKTDSLAKQRVYPQTVIANSIQTNKLEFGKLYFMYYSPKHAKTLPWYDNFPLFLPIQLRPNGFVGINLHYLNYRQRAVFFDRLMDFRATDSQGNDRIKAFYNVLKTSNKYVYYKPTIKRYLVNHIRSKFIVVDQKEWNLSLFIPCEAFKKEKKEVVWNDSAGKIKKK